MIAKFKINEQKRKQLKDSVLKVNGNAEADYKVFTHVENEPKFPGGDTAWLRYL